MAWKPGESGNPKGGNRRGGRTRIPQTRSVNEAVEAARSGIMPKDFLLQAFRNELPGVNLDVKTRIDIATDLMPYYHPRLASIEHSGEQKVVYHIADKPMTMDEWAAKWAGVDTTARPTNVTH